MNAIFHEFIGNFMEVYIDDVMVKLISVSQHIDHLRKAFLTMRKKGLKMNPLKCAFGVSAGNFLGFVVHKKGIAINKNKADAILALSALKSKKEVQSFLATENTIGCMLAQDDENGNERAIYYLSRVLTDIETRGRLGKWMLALTEFDLQYVPARAVKRQVIADFLVDNSKDLNDKGANVVDVEINYWKLYFDGSKHKDGAEVGIIIISPEGRKENEIGVISQSCILAIYDKRVYRLCKVPLIEVDQSEIIDFVEEHIIHRFGIPQTLSTNQVTMFTGQRVKNLQPRGVLIWLLQLPIMHRLMVLPLEINLNTLRVSKQNEFPVDDYWNAMFDELNELDSERILSLIM
ncbi:uncharacterized protein LOC130949683 [Arachis stenosperma]|uniref:uncharacterized protein LOC130949683 n=1 Tax=Arachis stenosperma TaxID=217475 RepID=UPI0025ACE4B2|nr:uncharacterized protein LOC130949683 [Arachis stenosperma]